MSRSNDIRKGNRCVLFLMLLLILGCTPLLAESNKISISLQDVEIQEVMKMLSKQQRLNIFVSDGVEGKVSINLYDMDVIDAVKSISEAAGYAVEERNGSYFIVDRDEVGKYAQSGLTEVRSFKVQYTKPVQVESILKDYLSSYGKITTLENRNILIVEDQPLFLDKIESILSEIDRQPNQILIEAKILEVTLTDNEIFGLDWTKFFSKDGGEGSFGVQNLSNTKNPGLFYQYLNSNVSIALNALKERGRLRTLSTPKLLAMEGREAEAVVGKRLGYKVTTTINQVTSESIEFIETGIILKVTPYVDRHDQIMLDIKPEVSDGDVLDGLPSKTTTQVSTRMLVPNGQTIFLGGLIKQSTRDTKEGVPLLGDLPLIGPIFSNNLNSITTTEIIVLITPKMVDFNVDALKGQEVEAVSRYQNIMDKQEEKVDSKMRQLMDEDESKDVNNQDYIWNLDI